MTTGDIVELDRTFSMDKLQEIARQNGIRPVGSKKDLIRRLLDSGITLGRMSPNGLRPPTEEESVFMRQPQPQPREARPAPKRQRRPRKARTTR